MKQTTSARAADSPAKQAAPNPGRGSSTTCAPSDGRQRARPVGRPVVDHDRLVAGGHALEHPGQGLTFVENGENDGIHVWDTYPCYAAAAITDQ